jgi:hypothetical protein
MATVRGALLLLEEDLELTHMLGVGGVRLAESGLKSIGFVRENTV